MEINIFLLCYNESALLPNTIHHYKKNLPSCKITIYDNESTDNSVEIANQLSCNVVSWNSNNIQDDYIFAYIKNNVWKDILSGWIIIADMDEWLCITEDELCEEEKNGTTIINTQGIDIIGESKILDLTDVDLHIINKYVDNPLESKKICFLRNSITDMNYNHGAHKCNPIGDIKYSTKIYFNKHMSYMGLPFIINKMIIRYERTELMRKYDMCIHYSNNIEKITDEYNQLLDCAQLLD
jgi:hypothetical protein